MIEYIRMAFLQRESDQSSRCPLILAQIIAGPCVIRYDGGQSSAVWCVH